MSDLRETLFQAAYKGDLATVTRIIKADRQTARIPSSPDIWEGSTPLSLAALGGHIEIARFLLENGAPVNPMTNDGSALLMAAWAGKDEMVKLLLERGADPNLASASGETPLMAAALKGFVPIGQLLIDAGANVNAQTTHGTTDFFNTSPPVCGESPLHLAAAYGYKPFAQLLLDRGADKTLKDHSGQRPLHWAARHHRDELLSLLK